MSRFIHHAYWQYRLSRTAGPTVLLPDLLAVADESAYQEVVAPQPDSIRIGHPSDLSFYAGYVAAFSLLCWQHGAAPARSLFLGAFPWLPSRSDHVLPLTFTLNPASSWADWQTHVKAIVVEAFAHQDYPVELAPENSPRMLILMNRVHRVPVAGPWPLILVGSALADAKPQLTVRYRPDLHERVGVEALASQCVTLMERAAHNPETALSDLSAVSDRERHQLLVTFNGPHREYDTDRSLAGRFCEQAARNPERVAVQHGAQSVTYLQLDQQSGRLAATLVSAGVRPGDAVGVFMERGLAFVSAILGILKAGGVYVPLDAQYPDERIRHMVSDSGMPVLVVSAQAAPRLAGGAAAYPQLKTLLCPDAEGIPVLPAGLSEYLNVLTARHLEAADPGFAPVKATARDVAYMVYTSGSTGLPKGARVRQDGALNHIDAECEALGLGGDWAFLQSAPASSDISVWQFLAPLVTGGRVVIADYETLCDPRRLCELIEASGVTLVELVPGLFQALLKVMAQRPASSPRFPKLRMAMITGETAPVPLVREWFRQCPAIPLVNAYGPTEAADDVCQHLSTAAPPTSTRTLPIGQPIANMSLYVLDEQLRLAPLGARGEIAVSGVGVGCGYWNQEAKTRAQFVPNPFAGPGHGPVLYKTGDWGRWRADGALEFLGRVDLQEKIRGFRIELEEIERALLDCAGVLDAVVVPREDAQGQKRLVAFWVAEPGLEAAALRAAVEARLPSYMRPSAYHRLDALPRLPNGKVNRDALPTVGAAPAAPVQGSAEVENERERQVREVWKTILKVETVGVHDNFFEVGGHSLLVADLVQALRPILGMDLTLVDVFAYPTIRALAACAGTFQTPASAGASETAEAQRQARVRNVRQSQRERRQGRG